MMNNSWNEQEKIHKITISNTVNIYYNETK
jgi:hypothetical protein